MTNTIRIHGLPTSGKTTFARCARLVGIDVIDTDDVFGSLFPDIWDNRHNDVLSMNACHAAVGAYTYQWSLARSRSPHSFIVSNLYSPEYIEGMGHAFDISYYRDDADEVLSLMKQRKHGGHMDKGRIQGWIDGYLQSSCFENTCRINLSELRRAAGVTKPQFISSTPSDVWYAHTNIKPGINLEI